VDRLACVEVVQLPLQVLLASREGWREHPAAVVAEDKPQGLVTFANAAARREGVLPGQRYAAALGLCAGLRAAVVGGEEREAALARIEAVLERFTPGIERSREHEGAFWLDVRGMGLLEPSLPDYAARIVAAIGGVGGIGNPGFVAHVAIGFRRFATRVAARTRPGAIVFATPEDEQRFLAGVELARADVDSKLRDELAKLGVTTLGAFARLPRAGLRSRFGKLAEELHRKVCGDAVDPFQPAPPRESLERRLAFEPPLEDATSLLFFLRRLLDELLAQLARGGQALEEFELRLELERGAPHAATLKPAAPTLDSKLLLQLATLHLERSFAPEMARSAGSGRDGILELRVTGKGARARAEQLALFRDNPRRDLRAAARALALLRSRFGEAAVGRVVVVDAHLPEARFRFEPFAGSAEIALPRPVPALERVAIRRIFEKPIVVSPPRRHPHDDGWIVHDLKQGTVLRADGPYLVSGGWWAAEVTREYRYVHTLAGDVLWVFHDKKRRRWLMQGRLE
jgi:protein ImuB